MSVKMAALHGCLLFLAKFYGRWTGCTQRHVQNGAGWSLTRGAWASLQALPTVLYVPHQLQGITWRILPNPGSKEVSPATVNPGTHLLKGTLSQGSKLHTRIWPVPSSNHRPCSSLVGFLKTVSVTSFHNQLWHSVDWKSWDCKLLWVGSNQNHNMPLTQHKKFKSH